jgi:hypothetical protein
MGVVLQYRYKYTLVESYTDTSIRKLQPNLHSKSRAGELLFAHLFSEVIF